MRKLLLVVLATLCITSVVQSQNIQAHYDLGSDLYDELSSRPSLTTTVEMFRPDDWGSTYFFVDMDYTSDGVASAYWEISRELKFWKTPVSIHVEYNGGLAKQFSYNHAYLLGATYSHLSKDMRRSWSLTAAFKYIQKHESPCNFQITGVWSINFLHDNLMTFTGFFDWWREQRVWDNTTNTEFIFMTEPQLWLNLNGFKGISDKFRLSIGTELECSYNFVGGKKFYVLPTLALKWTF